MSLTDELKAQEIYELDRKLRQCARLVMKPYLQPYADRRNPSEDMHEAPLFKNMDLFWKGLEVLYGLRFPNRSSKELRESKAAIKELLITTFMQMSTEDCPETMQRIMLPIGIYTIVVNHCFNRETVEKRGDRKKGKPVEFRHRELCRIVRTISEEKPKEKIRFYGHTKAFVILLKIIDGRYRKRNNDGKKHGFLREYGQVDLALKLAEQHKDVIYYEESAQIGLFLREILLVKSADNNPLDCILEMYIANEMDNLLIRTGVMKNLTPDVFWDLNSENALLRWYYESRLPKKSKSKREEFVEYWEQIEREYSQLSQLCKNKDYKKIRNLYESHDECICEKGSDEFQNLYKDIRDSYKITDTDKDELINFYLDYRVLKDATDLRHTSLIYLKAVIRSLFKKGKVTKAIKTDYSKLKKIITASDHERCSFVQKHIIPYYLHSVIMKGQEN